MKIMMSVFETFESKIKMVAAYTAACNRRVATIYASDEKNSKINPAWQNCNG
jgi:hypothetical protein